ncbi:MAG: chromate transporter [Eubacteriales bacterium]
MNKKNVPSLFLTFLKIGAFTFGGGYAMIPLIQKEAVEQRKWITDDDILEIVAIAESTPGPIAVNAATFVGYRVAGFFGALAATLGVVLPSFVIIMLVSLILNVFKDAAAVRYAFFGVRAGVLALIVKALRGMYKQCPKNIFSYIVAAVAFALVTLLDLNVLFVILICAAAGLTQALIVQRRCGK